ncbi:hypothetical protein P153DRAFT_368781 [Dothidotthia symphoricarpi CBS 119687]|uniref:AhpC-TSA-domain-containing protein n=1 Tax=Dothidotthia symphoricarpi CBS 119687 TaxID=1392245 RepID=A0A6A6A498_9PLEO|nr:uncharacterized protein P153DRAFT_368781 [Dothidotthia symphoricarpi CBS 119687]KAF2126719.1 hypothetical protein P153DRAFT_368781 [Dothidotthia symphoricarpi CBS 119687]
MEPSQTKTTDFAPPTSAAQPSPPPSRSGLKAEPKASMSSNRSVPTTPPFSPTNDASTIAKGQEEFEGNVEVDNHIPTEKELSSVEDLHVLDAKGQSIPFKELYKGEGVAPRQLIIFIRHFFCGNCQEYLRTIASSITPDDLLALPTPTFITVIGCGRPELIQMYTEATSCPFPIYADPTRKLYDILGMTRTYNLGAKPEYIHTHMLINSVQSVFQSLGTGKNALKGGDFKQVGGEFLFEDGECTWAHRMRNTRDHVEVHELRGLLGLDGTRPPLRKRWSHGVKHLEGGRRSSSWGRRLRSKSKGAKEGNAGASLRTSGKTTPERLSQEHAGTTPAV